MLSVYAQQTMVDVMPVGACIFSGPDHIINAANKLMLAVWGKDNAVIGKPLEEALPEIYNQGFLEQLNAIYISGEDDQNHDVKVRLLVNGQLKTAYFNYFFKPLRDQQGKIYSIVYTAINVTKTAQSQLKLKQMNKVLAATNTELIALNQQNIILQAEQAATYNKLIKSEQHLRSIFEQAPLALCMLNGPEHLVELANERMLKFWNRSAAVINNPYATLGLNPETTPSLNTLDNVYQSGITLAGHEVQVNVNYGMESRLGYFNFTYQPIRDLQGAITGILAIIEDVTERVETRNKGIRINEQLGLAVQAAKIGTWHLHPQTKNLTYNVMLTEILGYEAAEPMSYEQAINQVTDQYRTVIMEEIEKAMASGNIYDVIYQQRRFNDGKIIWLRSVGRISNNEHNTGTLFSGVVMDISELKQDEQRKNDFISMVSHELKTPLTSMNGYLQILALKVKKNDDLITARMLDRAQRQMHRMTTLVNGFLNVSRLESGQIYIDRNQFDMVGLIQEVQEEFATVYSHQFIFEPLECAVLIADRDKIGQVINNFITNAVKYSPLGTTIQVACEIQHGLVRVSVKDQGIGIALKDKDHLFDRFYRVKGEQTKSISGFGIGLYLCAEIIKRHNGQIGVDSAQDTGSTFWFTLAASENNPEI